jgi:putative SOS response-associated peptidase YedK
MCGRYVRTTALLDWQRRIGFAERFDMPESYNIAPSQSVAAVRSTTQEAPELVLLRWGLIPSWAKEMSIGTKLINARSETVLEKPAFRAAFRQRRCLILGDAFYEWQGHGKTKQPYCFHLRDREPFAFAGLWESWQHGQDCVQTCTIITTAANEVVQPIHARMPVIVSPQDYASWLASDTSLSLLHELTKPYPSDAMAAYPVRSWVNHVRHNDPRCLEPMPSLLF